MISRPEKKKAPIIYLVFLCFEHLCSLQHILDGVVHCKILLRQRRLGVSLVCVAMKRTVSQLLQVASRKPLPPIPQCRQRGAAEKCRARREGAIESSDHELHLHLLGVDSHVRCKGLDESAAAFHVLQCRLVRPSK